MTARQEPVTQDTASGLAGRIAAIDAALLAVPRRLQHLVIAATAIVMLAVSVPNVPRQYLDYSGKPFVGGVQQPQTYGTDTIADMYEAKVILNDPSDMYTKARLEQTPLEAATWSKEASAPYPPAALIALAALYAVGEWTGLGFYGMVLGLACVFFALSIRYFLDTRWYLFPVLYLNFGYFSHRFVYVQDGTYLIMLVVVMGALFLARARHQASHLMMAVAISMKLSPLYYAKNLPRMSRRTAMAFVSIVVAGLVLPYFIWENYLYIYRYGSELKGDWPSAIAALGLVVPFAAVLWYIETRLDFDLEDRIGWGLVPFALFLGLKMNVARHLLIVLLVPDKRGLRNVAAAIGLAFPTLFPSIIAFNSALLVSTAVLVAGLVYYLAQIGWDVVRDDVRNPGRTLRMMLTRA